MVKVSRQEKRKHDQGECRINVLTFETEWIWKVARRGREWWTRRLRNWSLQEMPCGTKVRGRQRREGIRARPESWISQRLNQEALFTSIFQQFSKNAHSRQPGKCESARTLKPEKCGSASALQLGNKSLSELQRSKPSRYHMSEVKRLQNRHLYIGRRASHLRCAMSFWATPFQVKRYGLMGAISKFEAPFNSSPAVQRELEQLSDKLLLCHCSLSALCHGDVLILAWEKRFLNVERQELDEEATQFRAAELRQQVEEPESQSDDEPERRGETFVCGSRSTRKGSTRRRRSLLTRQMVHREKGTFTDTRASKLPRAAEELRDEATKTDVFCKAGLREGHKLPFRSSCG